MTAETLRNIVIDTLKVINDEHSFNSKTRINIVDKLEKNKDIYPLFITMAKYECQGHESLLDYAYRLIK